MTTFEDLSSEVAAEAEAEGPEAVLELREFERLFAEARTFPRRCHRCGGSVRPSRDPITVSYRGEAIEVKDIEHGVCEKCGEVYLRLDAAAEVQRVVRKGR